MLPASRNPFAPIFFAHLPQRSCASASACGLVLHSHACVVSLHVFVRLFSRWRVGAGARSVVDRRRAFDCKWGRPCLQQSGRAWGERVMGFTPLVCCFACVVCAFARRPPAAMFTGASWRTGVAGQLFASHGSRSSAGESVRPITVRSAVQARVGPLQGVEHVEQL